MVLDADELALVENQFPGRDRDVFHRDERAARLGVVGFLVNAVRYPRRNVGEAHEFDAIRIRDGVAEEVEEEQLGEGVELGEGGAALGPQRLRPVQHLRYPPLEGQRGKWDVESGK